MKADDVKELRKLRDENQRLKRMVADQALDLEVLREVARERPPIGSASLTRAEREIANLVAEGMRHREIGLELLVSARTVETHLSHIYRKVTLAKRRELGRATRERNAPERTDLERGGVTHQTRPRSHRSTSSISPASVDQGDARAVRGRFIPVRTGYARLDENLIESFAGRLCGKSVATTYVRRTTSGGCAVGGLSTRRSTELVVAAKVVRNGTHRWSV